MGKRIAGKQLEEKDLESDSGDDEQPVDMGKPEAIDNEE